MHFLTRDRKFYADFFTLLLFIAVQNLITYSVNLADNVMLGRYSEEALSGVALANQVQFLLQMIVGSTGEGVVVLAAQYWGQRDTKPIGSIIGVGLCVGLCAGFVFLVAGLAVPEWVLGLLSNEAPMIREGAAYMRILCYSYVLFGVSSVLLAGMRSVQNVRIGLVVSITTLLINVSLNYLLIFGRFGFPRMGVRGAALATVIARAVELLIVIVYVTRIDRKLRLKLRDLVHIRRELAHDYRRVATPVILSGLSWGLAMFLQTGILGRLGQSAVAASSIAGSLFSVISVVAYGSASAAAVITGKRVGEGGMDRLRQDTRTMQILFLVIGLLSGLAILACRNFLLSIYDVRPETRAMAEQFILVLAVTTVGTAYQCPCLTGIVRGGGDTKFVFYNDLVFQWGVVLISSYLSAFVFKFPPVVVFACLKSDQVIKCIVAFFHVNGYRWVRKLTRE